MHFGKKRLPDNFEDYVTFSPHSSTMPDEHVYQFTLSVASVEISNLHGSVCGI